MSIRYVATMGLLLASVAAAQERAATVATPVAVHTRVLPIRDVLLPEKPFLGMSTAIARDGRRLVVSVSAFDSSAMDELMPGHPPTYVPQHPSTYLYDCETDKSVELRPVFDGKTWRLTGKSAISPDGRFVAAACTPEADDRVLNASTFGSTMALVDTTGNESRLIDLKALGFRAPVGPGAPSISRDAAFVAISTSKDFGQRIEHGWTVLWSREGGLVGAVVLDDEYDGTYDPRISDDGRFLAVYSGLSDHPESHPPGTFLMDLHSNIPGASPAWPGGRMRLDGWSQCLSGDGKRVAFMGKVPPDTSGARPGDDAVFVYDDASRSTTLVSGGPGESFSSAMTLGCGLSGSGAYVAFVKGPDPARGAEGVDPAVYVRELSSGRVARASGERDAGRVELGFDPPALSDDGRRVVFIRTVLRNIVHGHGEVSSEVVLADLDWSTPSPAAPH